MEPITLCGALILAFGIWLECESVVMRIVRAIVHSNAIAGIKTTAVQRPLYVKYMEGVR